VFDVEIGALEEHVGDGDDILKVNPIFIVDIISAIVMLMYIIVHIKP